MTGYIYNTLEKDFKYLPRYISNITNTYVWISREFMCQAWVRQLKKKTVI